MMDFLLENQDLGVTDGDFTICPTDAHAIAQTIVARLKIIQGEWFLDDMLGIPYFTEVFGQKRNERLIRQLIIPEIQSVSGVREITSFKITNFPDRKLTISFDALLSDGTLRTFNESVGV